jgi:hypothetical protein
MGRANAGPPVIPGNLFSRLFLEKKKKYSPIESDATYDNPVN